VLQEVLGMRLALAGLLVLVSCFPKDDATALHESRIVTTPGGSCGRWAETKGSPPRKTIVDATCAEGLSCVGLAYYAYEPADVHDRDFNTCLPADALRCDEPPNTCPEGFGCVVGFGMPLGGACIHHCTTHSDCPDTYQLCDSGSCTVLPCGDLDGGGGCWEGTHCQDFICRPD
jgi:hypothetical protein